MASLLRLRRLRHQRRLVQPRIPEGDSYMHYTLTINLQTIFTDLEDHVKFDSYRGQPLSCELPDISGALLISTIHNWCGTHYTGSAEVMSHKRCGRQQQLFYCAATLKQCS